MKKIIFIISLFGITAFLNAQTIDLFFEQRPCDVFVVLYAQDFHNFRGSTIAGKIAGMENKSERGRDLATQVIQRPVGGLRCHADHVFEACECHISGIRVKRHSRPWVAGVVGIEHVVGFLAANLADPDPVWPVAQRMFNEHARGDAIRWV